MESEATREVQIGASLLDDYFGEIEWWNRIDMREFSIASPHDCILGQLFPPVGDDCGYYIGGKRELGLKTGEGYGFCSSEYSTDEELETEWKKLILERYSL